MMPLPDFSGYPKNKFLVENVFLAAPKINSWLPEKHFSGCPKNKFVSARKKILGLPQK
jgi:hypothetical protein